MKILLFCLAAAAALAGCSEPVEPENSGDYTNGELYAEMEAVAVETGDVTVVARLSTGGTAMRLTDGDKFLASIGPLGDVTSGGGIFEQTASYAENVQEMKRRSHVVWNLLFVQTDSHPEYFAAMPRPGAGETLYVSLRRAVGSSIDDTSVPLPQAFGITAPLPGELADINVPLILSWQPAGTALSMELEMAASCDDGTGYAALRLVDGDPGNMEIDLLNDLFGGKDPGVPCTLGLAVSRVRYGTVSPGFGAGGLVRGVQRRTVTLRML